MEKDIEIKLRLMTQKRGGLCLKFVSPGWNGAPDRIVLMPDGRMGFVEVKDTGKKTRKIQQLRHKQLKTLGFKVFVVGHKEDIGGVLDAIQGS